MTVPMAHDGADGPLHGHATVGAVRVPPLRTRDIRDKWDGQRARPFLAEYAA